MSKKLSTLTEAGSSLQSIMLNGQCKTLSRRKAKWSDILKKDMRSEGKRRKWWVMIFKKPQPGSEFNMWEMHLLTNFH